MSLGKLKFTHTRLLVSDVDGCYKFYRDVLGLKPRFDGEGSVYAEFISGDHTIALFQRELMNKVACPENQPSRASSSDVVVMAFEVANVDDACHALSAAGVQFLTEPHDEPDWMIRVAHFRDPDGNLLEINHAIEVA